MKKADMTDDIETLRDALLIIAGEKQCLDNLMSNADVARESLAALERVAFAISDARAEEEQAKAHWSAAIERAIAAEAERDALRDADLVPRSLLAEANLEMASVCAEKLRAKDEKLRKAREALETYVSDGVWRINGQCDPYGPNFAGQDIARATLAEIEAD